MLELAASAERPERPEDSDKQLAAGLEHGQSGPSRRSRLKRVRKIIRLMITALPNMIIITISKANQFFGCIMPVSAFVSYSHVDDQQLDRLHKHLIMLRRDGQLQAWTDHEIRAGDQLDSTVAANLEASDLFIALVSPDYLASNYCYEKEFKHALALQKAGRLRIIAIIVQPCDWQRSPFSNFLVLPKDGKPVADWTNENSAYLNVTQAIRRVLETGGNDIPATTSAKVPDAASPKRRVRLKKDFDSIQKAEFADETFALIQSYFKASCKELEQASDEIRTRFEPLSPTSFACTVVNRATARRRGEAYLSVHRRNGSHGALGDISYSHQQHAAPGSSNGWFMVEADEYKLHFVGLMSRAAGKETQLTAQDVAYQLWGELVRRADIEYE